MAGHKDDIEQHKEYLGDGVYARFDGATMTLTTEDGINIQNIVYMDGYVITALIQYIRKHGIAPLEVEL